MEVKKAKIVPVVAKNVIVKDIITNIEKEERRNNRLEAEKFAKSDAVAFIYDLENLWERLVKEEPHVNELEIYLESLELKVQWHKGERTEANQETSMILGTSRLYSVAMVFALAELDKLDLHQPLSDFFPEEELLLWQIHMERIAIASLSIAKLLEEVLFGNELERSSIKHLLTRLLELVLDLPVEDGYEVLLGEQLGLKNTRSIVSRDEGFSTTAQDAMSVLQYVSKQGVLRGIEAYYNINDTIMVSYFKPYNTYISIIWKENNENTAIYAMKAMKRALIDRQKQGMN